MNQLTEFQQRAVVAALEKLFTGIYFDVTTLRKIADLTGAQLRGKDFEALEAMHCVHYSKMDKELQLQVREKCLELLGLPPQTIDLKQEDQPSEPPKKPRLAWWR